MPSNTTSYTTIILFPTLPQAGEGKGAYDVVGLGAAVILQTGLFRSALLLSSRRPLKPKLNTYQVCRVCGDNYTRRYNRNPGRARLPLVDSTSGSSWTESDFPGK
jgi:hypothetical protein